MEFILNGQPVHAEGFAPQTTLLDELRQRGLTGSKEGCAEGECGACAVLLVRPHGTGSCYQPVNSCLMFLPMLAGQEIYTVEALAENGRLAEAQAAMASYGGSQCGYCTPGFVVSLFAEQYRPDRTGPCDPHAMAGNLCRCTGYRPIRDAALSLGPPPACALKDRMSLPAPSVAAMNYRNNGSTWHRPGTLAECLALLAAHPEARLIAGATDLAVESNLRFRRWDRSVNLEALTELREFHDAADAVEIGAGLSLSEIEQLWSGAPPVLREWMPLFASPLIRNRATLGGNLATASPIGDGAPLLLALDAELRLVSAASERTQALASFFRGYRDTALLAGELIRAIRIPKPLPAYARFYKIAKRRMDDISTVAACFALDLDSAGRVERARFAFGGVAAVPLRAIEAENAVAGRRWDRDAVTRVQEILGRTLKPISDHRGSAAYRVRVAQSLVEKFWWERQQQEAA